MLPTKQFAILWTAITDNVKLGVCKDESGFAVCSCTESVYNSFEELQVILNGQNFPFPKEGYVRYIESAKVCQFLIMAQNTQFYIWGDNFIRY